MPSIPLLDVAGVTKRFGSSVIVDNASLTASKGEIIALLGPSGCGKTTLLRMIANLATPDAGEIRIAGDSIVGRPPHLSEASMLFQSYALFPHLTVERNIAFGLEVRHRSRAATAEIVDRMLDIVALPGFERRRPSQLSGGQQQRVALARALAVSPKILLLDEPFGALDKKLREQTAIEVLRVIREFEMTTVFVTHDQEEALTMADRIAVMDRGRIVQIGPGLEIYTRPETEFVAQFVGVANLLPGVVRAAPGGNSLVVESEAGLSVPVAPAPNIALAAGTAVQVLLRPENIAMKPASAARPAATPGKIIFGVQFGSHTDYQIRAAGRILKVRSAPSQLAVGDDVDLAVIDTDKCVLFRQGVRAN